MPAVPTVNVVAGRAGDRRRLVDGQREGLRGVGADAVAGGEGEGIGAAGAGRGRAAQRRRCSALNVTPLGSAPVSLSVGAGNPVAVTVNVPAVPTVNVVLFALVIAGAWLTVSVKLCVASGADAVGGGERERIGAAGARRRRAAEHVPCRRCKVTPLGSAPVSLSAGVGKPVAVTVNVPAVPTVNVVLLALVIAGAWFTVSVKLCVASRADAVAGGDGQRIGAAGARRGRAGSARRCRR